MVEEMKNEKKCEEEDWGMSYNDRRREMSKKW